MIKKIALIALPVALAAGFTSCSDDDNNDDLTFTVSTAALKDQMTADGYWDQTYQDNTGLTLNGLKFSHSSNAEWYSWSGFTPSVSTDNKEYPSDQLLAHQWSAITGAGATASGNPYFVVYPGSTVHIQVEAGQKYDAEITSVSGDDFHPVSVKITNSSYGYYAIKNGSAFNKKFAQNDYFTLLITGFEDGVKTGDVEVSLAANGAILNNWRDVDLRGLGEVDRIVFTMTSSDTAEFDGVAYMNNPAYFCMDEFKVSDLD